MVPEGWVQAPLGKLVERVARPVSVDPATRYEQIGIRSHGKGLFNKEPVTGAALGNKRVFWVEPNCLILNIVFAWEQAVGITTAKEIGKIASHRFPMYKPRDARSDVDYLAYFFKTPYGKHLLALASPGGAGRNKTLGQNEFLKTIVCVPSIREQRTIVHILKTWDRAIEAVDSLIHSGEAQKRALIQKLVTGKTRLPEFKDRDWQSHTFGRIATVGKKRYDPKNSRITHKCIELEHLESGTGRLLCYCDAQSQESMKAVFETNDVLYGKLRPYLKKFYLADAI